jgi:hypothetical protein
VFRTVGDQVSLWESLLPEEVLRLPTELARVDALLDDAAFFGAAASLKQGQRTAAAPPAPRRGPRRVLLSAGVGCSAAPGRNGAGWTTGLARSTIRDRLRTRPVRSSGLAAGPKPPHPDAPGSRHCRAHQAGRWAQMAGGRYPVEMVRGVPVVAAPAEIDARNADWLRAVLLEAACRGHGTFVVDMTGTRFAPRPVSVC